MLEGVLARGDRKVAAVIEEAYENGLSCLIPGARSFDNDTWMQAFENCGVDIGFL